MRYNKNREYFLHCNHLPEGYREEGTYQHHSFRLEAEGTHPGKLKCLLSICLNLPNISHFCRYVLPYDVAARTVGWILLRQYPLIYPLCSGLLLCYGSLDT